MKSFIFATLGLLVGGGAGYYAGFAITKKKYIKIADKEVESVKKSLKEYYESKENIKISSSRADDGIEPKEEIKKNIPESPFVDKSSIDKEKLKGDNEKDSYEKYAKQYKAPARSKKVKKEEPVVEGVVKATDDNIYILSPDEFADSELDVNTLNYYLDGVVADDDYNIIKDINGTIGSEALSIFDNHKKDVVYVRNERLGIDYEILRNYDNYYDVAPVPRNDFPGEDD